VSSPLHLVVGSLQVALSLHSLAEGVDAPPSVKSEPAFNLQVALALSLHSPVVVGRGHSPFVQSTIFGLLQAPALGGSLGRH
jgi:hypothetical protein